MNIPAFEDLKQIYANSKAPVVLLDGDTFDVLWSNEKVQTDRPGFLRAGVFEMPGRPAILERLNRFGSVYYRQEPFPAMTDGIIFLKNGDFIVAIADNTSELMGPESSFSVDGIDFYTNIMRGSIDGITLSSQSIERMIDNDNVEVDRLFANIRRSSYKILRNVQNATLLSKYITGTLRIKRQSCNINEHIGAICLAAQSICKTPVKINLSLPYEEVVTGVDVRLAERAFLNVLLNSMVNTRDGNEIDVALSHTATQVMLTVRDRGAGIKAANLPHVKEPYFSCEPADDGGLRPGLGLGLSVAAIFCHLHGGTLLIDSEYGEGTNVAMYFKKANVDDEIFLASIASYVTDAFSPVYVELCDICEIPY